MPAFLSPGTELKRFGRGILPKLAVLVMIIVPILYGCMYVWAFWNPTEKLDRIPVALVNEDHPVTTDGRTVSAGHDVVKELLDKKPLDLEVTSEQKAIDGVSDGTYYFAVTIPKDFSANIASIGEDDPTHARMNVVYNDTNSFLGSTLGKSAMTAIRASVSEGIGKQASDQVLVGLGKARDGFVQGSDGALKLADGSTTLKEGLTKAKSGIDQLDTGAGKLADGASTASTGAQSLASGAASAADGAGKLSKGAVALATGTGRLADGAGKLGDGVSKLDTGAGKLAGGASSLADGTGKLADGAGELGDGVTQLDTGAGTLADGASSLADGTGQLVTGAGNLATGAQQADAGAQQLVTGTSTYVDGVKAADQALADTSAQIFDGANGLVTGSRSVSDGVTALVDQTTKSTADLNTLNDELKALAAANQGNATGDALTQITKGLDEKIAAAQAQAGTAAALKDGAARLATGTQQAEQGLAQYRAQAFESTDPQKPGLIAGAEQLQSGAQSLAQGTSSLTTGAQTLSTSSGQLNDGAQSLATGSKNLHSGTSKLNSQVPTLTSGVDQVNSGARSLATGSKSLASGTSKLNDQVPTLTSGVDQVNDGAKSLATGSKSLASGTAQLSTGANRLSDGVVSLLTGANQLHTGTGELKSGAPKLVSGAGKLHDGSHELGTKLGDGAGRIPDDDHATRTNRAASLANPVRLAADYQHKAQGYGLGFAPYFISLALYVGALVTWLLLRPVSSRALAFNTSGLRAVLTSYTAAAMIGIGQALAVLAVMHWWVGVDPAHAWGTVLFTILIAWTFLALQQMFNVVFGPAPGKVVTLVMLILQLVASGGTYPVQTTPAFLQWIHPAMPMTYTVNGLRALLTGGVDGRLWTAIVVLVCIAVASIAISAIRARSERTWTMSRLHPEIEI